MRNFQALLFAVVAILFLAIAPIHAQTVNSNGIANANFNSVTPTADANYAACLFKSQAQNVILECPITGNVLFAIPYSTTPSLNLTSASVLQFSCTTAGASIVPTVTGFAKGIEFTIIFVQNGTTACTWTWPSTIHGGTAVSATLSSVSVQSFIVSNNGTDAYAQAAGAVGQTGGTP